ncbi:MAG TPA: hypothetical protein VH143_29660 [Kofleriaceae bacterium]|nr:hypothetical protein [Kofleriaceae bacterium]
MTKRLALAVVLALCSVALADDDTVEPVHMAFVERGDDLVVSTKIQKLFDEAAYAALGTGFASTIVINTFVYPQNGSEPIAAAKVVRSVVYDIWDETYIVQLESSAKPVRVKFQSEALKLLTTIDNLPIAQLVDMPYEDIFVLRMNVLLNPVDKKTLAEVQRWLSQGTGGGLDRGGVFFGSFVSVFVHPKIADADRVLQLRSQPFFRPKP